MLVLIQIYKLTFVLHGLVIFNTSQIPNLATGRAIGLAKKDQNCKFQDATSWTLFGHRCPTLAITNGTPQIPQKC